jgi:hypothetical protein
MQQVGKVLVAGEARRDFEELPQGGAHLVLGTTQGVDLAQARARITETELQIQHIDQD